MLSSSTSHATLMRPLTRLQAQVLDHLAEGCLNKEIAGRLGVSDRMARKHIENLMRRYSVSNRVALLRAAIQAGDVDVGRPERLDVDLQDPREALERTGR